MGYDAVDRKTFYQETLGGRKFYLDVPAFNIWDIAGALAKQCRFNGHCDGFYSVAEHSVLVSLITEGDPFEGLMHDATEAYMGDLVLSIKLRYPEYRADEDKLWEAVAKQYDLPAEMSVETKIADTRAVMMEADMMMYSRGKKWPGYQDFGPHTHDFDPEEYIKYYRWEDAEEVFLKRYNELIGKR